LCAMGGACRMTAMDIVSLGEIILDMFGSETGKNFFTEGVMSALPGRREVDALASRP